MRSARDDHDGRIAELESADAMRHGDAHLGPALADARGDVLHLALGHRDVRLVLEVVDRMTPRVIAHHTGEGHDPAAVGPAYLCEQGIEGQRRRLDPDPPRPAAHGREQGHLVAVAHGRIERHALSVERHHQAPVVARHRGQLALRQRQHGAERAHAIDLKDVLLLSDGFT